MHHLGVESGRDNDEPSDNNSRGTSECDQVIGTSIRDFNSSEVIELEVLEGLYDMGRELLEVDLAKVRKGDVCHFETVWGVSFFR